jgi:mannan endo-1,4-beta-mannosidase
MIKLSRLLLTGLLFLIAACSSKSDFVKVNNTHFEIADNKYYFLGTNFWYGLNLGSKGAGGDRERLNRELDRLQALGINNLRIMAGSEGPDTEPYRMVPALQKEPGVYNEEVLDGLDYLLHEMRSRNMYAVVCLTNFWNWSGGMAQYIVWSGAADSIPYPPPHPGGDWGRYQEFTAQFYSNQKAMEMLDNHIRFIVNRKNTYSDLDYKSDPTIMAWELCNEPRGLNNIEAYRKWINNTAGLIKNLDPNHLVTIGSEGTTSSSYSGTDPETDHADANIDYLTIHIWVQNWGVYDPQRPDLTFDNAVNYAISYLDQHEEVSKKINKPMVMEEFGISRDLNNHDPNSATIMRDQYYERVFEAVYKMAAADNSIMSGCNFWAWAGEGRPRQPEAIWKAGDDFVGDPPHETQGWYSVYDKDSTTNAVIKTYAAKMNALNKNIAGKP